MSDEKEREDLEALTKAPGWLRYVNALQKEYTGRFDDYVSAAVNGKGDALQELLKLTAARTAVMAALRYPNDRIRQIDDAAKNRAVTDGVLARGGAL